MIRDMILQTAMQQYAAYGIKGVSMNEIANSLRISKRTLYCNFRSKEELISESVRTETAKIRQLLEQSIMDSSSAMEAVLRFKQQVRQHNICVCPAFSRDLPRFPEAYNEFNAFKNELYGYCKTLLEEAVKEGMLIAEQNYDLIARLYAEDIENSPTQYELVITLLRGSCTAKGKEWLESFK